MQKLESMENAGNVQSQTLGTTTITEPTAPILANKASGHQLPIYFDCNATTPTHPLAAQAAQLAMQGLFGNPSSSHAVGLEARHILEHTRSLAATVLGAAPNDRIVFTSGATEAIHIAIFSAFDSISRKRRNATTTTPATSNLPSASPSKKEVALFMATEHKAVPQALFHWNDVLNLNLDIQPVPVDRNGQIDLLTLQSQLENCVFLATMAVNNETGVVTPTKAVEKLLLATKSPAVWLVDCVQALGKVPLNLQQGRIDFATFSGHKLYAPKGVGFLYAKEAAPLRPFIVGGGQEKGIRCGTENIPGVAALGVVLAELLRIEADTQKSKFLQAELSPVLGFHNETQLRQFRKQIATALLESFPGVVFNAPFELSVGTTLNFSVPGLTSKEIISVFDAAGMQLSAGSACSAGKALRSYVLDAMGVDGWRSSSAVRLSLGPATTEEEVKRGVTGIRRAASVLQSSCLLPGNIACLQESTEAAEQQNAKTHNTSDLSALHGVLQFSTPEGESWIITDGSLRTAIVIDTSEPCLERVFSFLRCRGISVLHSLHTFKPSEDIENNGVTTTHGQHMLSQTTPSQTMYFQLVQWQTKQWKGYTVYAMDLSPQLCLLSISMPPEKTQLNQPQASQPQASQPQASETEASTRCAFVLLNNNTPTHCFFGHPSSAFETDVNHPHRWRATQNISHQECNFATQLSLLLPPECLFCISGCKNPAAFLRCVDVPLYFNQDSNLPSASEKEIPPSGIDPLLKGLDLSTLIEACTRKTAVCSALLEKKIVILDVRETWEWLASDIWHSTNFNPKPKNVPLSRLVQYASQLLLSGYSKDTPLLCVCASGYRSTLAAFALQRLGFANAFSLDGGVACSLRAVSLTKELGIDHTFTPQPPVAARGSEAEFLFKQDKEFLDYSI